MHHRGASEVHEAEPLKPALPRLAKVQAAPGPVPEDRIDEGADEHGVQEVSDKARPFRHGAGNDRGRGGAEDRLEEQKGPAKAGGLSRDLRQRLAVSGWASRVEEKPAGPGQPRSEPEHDPEADHPEDDRA